MRKKSRVLAWLATAAVAGVAVIGAAFAPAIANAESTDSSQKGSVEVAEAADGSPEGAIEWYQSKEGDASFEGMCEKAAENSYGTTGVWPSAIDHWNGAIEAGNAHEGDTDPPAGAFLFWNTSEYGHVGIADGEGGFWASSVDGTIGHGDDLGYYGDNYLGWAEPGVPGAKQMSDDMKQH